MMNDHVSLYTVVNSLCKTVNQIIDVLNSGDAGTGVKADLEKVKSQLNNFIAAQSLVDDRQDTAIDKKYGADNPPPYPVTSVNGLTGAVVIGEGGSVATNAYTPENPPPYPVTKVNGETGSVWVRYLYNKERTSNLRITSAQSGRIGLFNAYTVQDDSASSSELYWKIDDDGTLIPYFAVYADGVSRNHQLYSSLNPPPYPVTSVNGQTGDVTIEAGSSSDPSDAYTPSNPPPYPVTSVNGQTGAVTINAYTASNPPPYPVTSVNGQTGAVTIDTSGSKDAYTPSNPPPYPVTSVNGMNGAVTINAYTPSNPPPYPVTSVNGKTGAVTIESGSPDAYTPSNPPPYPVKSVNGQTGAVTLFRTINGSLNTDDDGYEYMYFSVPKQTIAILNSPLGAAPSTYTLPSGNTAYFTIKFSGSATGYSFMLFPTTQRTAYLGYDTSGDDPALAIRNMGDYSIPIARVGNLLLINPSNYALNVSVYPFNRG